MTDEQDDLLSYKRSELGCVADLRRLMDLAVKTGINQSILDLTADVLNRVENKCFSIAVVGEFKRGKSTFINALLGREVLPADILPCSATVNRVTYGLKPLVSIRFKAEDGSPPRTVEIGIDQLADYVTKLTPESKVNAAQIEEAVVQYPTEYCRNNVDIIDTPGLNDDDTMTAVTMSVIPKVDAAILVIMPESPFSGYEGDFLTKHLLLQDLGRVMFVVNAIDRLRRPQDRERIVTEIQNRITEAVETRLKEQFAAGSEEYNRYRQQIGIPKVFPLSAQLALEGRQNNDDRLLKESRFQEFTSALNHFLTHGRGAIELQVLANRILATADEIIKKINIEIGALSMALDEFHAAYDNSMETLANLRRQRDSEIEKINDAAARTQQRLEPAAARIAEDLKKAAGEAIDAIQLTADDLKDEKSAEATERLNRQVSAAVRQRAQRSAESLQLEIERDLRTELVRLQEFAVTLGTTLGGIESQFGSVQVDSSPQQSAASQTIAAAVATFTGFGGIWSGYREAGLKGGLVGGVASVGTAMVGGVIAAVLSLPVSLPLILGLGIASIFTGGWAAKKLFAKDRIERFKENYRTAIMKTIDEELQKMNLPGQVDKQIESVYGALKTKIVSESTASIEQTQSTLEELSARKARDEVMSEHNRREKEEIREEVAAIRSKGLRVANQLTVSVHA